MDKMYSLGEIVRNNRAIKVHYLCYLLSIFLNGEDDMKPTRKEISEKIIEMVREYTKKGEKKTPFRKGDGAGFRNKQKHAPRGPGLSCRKRDP